MTIVVKKAVSLKLWEDADNAFHAACVKQFGSKKAGDKCYQPVAFNDQTMLAYLAFLAAGEACRADWLKWGSYGSMLMMLMLLGWLMPTTAVHGPYHVEGMTDAYAPTDMIEAMCIGYHF